MKLGVILMEFLKADVNLKLLLIILVISIVFISSSVYYQNKIAALQKEYDKKIESLKNIEEKMLVKEKKLNEISELKDSIEKDKAVLEIGYLTLQDENQELKVEKTSLMEGLSTRPFAKALCKKTGNVQCLN